MKSLFLILFIVSAKTHAATSVDLLTDFESGTQGAAINVSYWSNVTHGTASSGWYLEVADTGDWKVDTNASFSFPGGFLCGGTNYSGGTRGAKVTVNDSFFWDINVPFPSNASGGMHFMFDPPTNTLNVGYDLLTIGVSGGQSGTAQWNNAAPPFIHAHNAGTPPLAYVTPGVSYWLTWKFTSGLNFKCRIYDTNWNQVSNETTNTFGVGTMDVLTIGMNSHGTPGTQRLYYDNIVMDWTTAVYPLLPIVTAAAGATAMVGSLRIGP